MAYAGARNIAKAHSQKLKAKERKAKTKAKKILRPSQYEEKGDYTFQPKDWYADANDWS